MSDAVMSDASPGPLSVPAFRRLTVAWSFGNFGDSALYLTLAIWVKDLTGSDARASLVFLFLGLPAFLAPLAGHLADRFSRRRLIAVSNAVAAVGLGALLFVSTAAQVWIVYLVAFGYGLLTFLNAACVSGIVRDLLPDEHLAPANGLLSTIDQGLRLLSPLAGAGLYTVFGGGALAVLTASTLLISGAIVATMRIDETPPTPSDERDGFAAEVMAGIRHIRSVALLGMLTLWVTVAFAVTGFLNSAIFAAIEQGLGRGSSFFAVIGAAQGLGAVAGGVASARIIARVGERVAVGLALVLMGSAVTVLGTTSTAVMLTGAFVAGFSIPIVIVAYTTVRQVATPGVLQGRVSAASGLAFTGPQTIATGIGAGLIAVIDYRLMIGAIVVPLVLSGVMVLASRARPVEPIPLVEAAR